MFVLTTKSGIHKVSYDVKRREGYEISLVMESPYLDNGYAALKLVVDNERGKYEGHFSLNNDHFFTGILHMDEDGLEAKLQIDSILLQEKLQLRILYKLEDEEFKSMIEFKFKSRHEVKVEFDQKKQEFYLALETRFLPCSQVSLLVDIDTLTSPKRGRVIISYGDQSI